MLFRDKHFIIQRPLFCSTKFKSFVMLGVFFRNICFKTITTTTITTEKGYK